MSGRYDRRPLREWEQGRSRRSATEQIGLLRLIGLVVILAAAYLVLRPDPRVPAPTSGADPRIAIDAALAPTVRTVLPRARLTTGSSEALAHKVQGDVVVDLVILSPRQVALLASTERCSQPEPIAERGTTRFVACQMNANGSSRALAAKALAAITGIEGREALLAAGYDIPEVRPTSPVVAGDATSPESPAAAGSSATTPRP